MRAGSGNIQDHLDLESQNRALLLRLTRKDGEIFRFTNRDVDIEWDDGTGLETYAAGSGFTASSVLVAIGTGIQGMSIKMLKRVAGITDADLEGGLWTDAQCLLVMVRADLPTDGYLIIFGGDVQQIQDDEQGGVEFEVRGLIRNSRVLDVESYSFLCRADLGDARCQVDIEALSELFTVDVASSNQRFSTIELNQADDHWNLGVIQWITGANAGLSMEIKDSDSSSKLLILAGQMPFSVVAGDTGKAWPGCDKSLSTCIARYNNAVNFRGEPYIPLPEAIESVS